MPHQRNRHAVGRLEKLLSFWPVVGVLGARQVGKTTLLREIYGRLPFLTLDDDDVRESALNSGKMFLSRHPQPLILDEVQKAPNLFDAIKSRVDRKRVPGSYLISGSTAFSSKIGIRESLTGRMGMLRLYPMTMAERYQKSLAPSDPKLRFNIEDVSASLSGGGVPVPAFARDERARNEYWRNWYDTMLNRDLSRLFKRGFDPDFAHRILRQMGSLLAQGELPGLDDFKGSSRRVKNYLDAMCNVFVIQRFDCHERGIGKPVWLPFDSGFAHFLMGWAKGPDADLSLARIFIFNEILAGAEYRGEEARLQYFKSRKGTPVDFVWRGIPVKIVASTRIRHGWDDRPLHGAMKSLQVKRALLCTPTDQCFLPSSKEKIGVVPWGYWS